MDRNSLTLLAVLALSVSNLFVGITTQNKLLILASAAISAALAIFYIFREWMRQRMGAEEEAVAAPAATNGLQRPARFPLWVFVVILFIILPALMWFLSLTTPAGS
nr:hypothetical protein [Hyphomonas sp. Mor2]